MAEENKDKINTSGTIKKLTKEELEVLIEKCNNTTDILRKLNLSTASYYIRLLSKIIKSYGLKPPSKRTTVPFFGAKKELNEILVENSTYDCRANLKKRLFDEGLLENKCQECGIDPEWNGKKLSLQLDHINGVNNDHRIENLRMLCPNCHSQTDTYAGKRFKQIRKCACGSILYEDYDAV
jgi:5-methylcytosine-specific restriction endonuclease McrA